MAREVERSRKARVMASASRSTRRRRRKAGQQCGAFHHKAMTDGSTMRTLILRNFSPPGIWEAESEWLFQPLVDGKIKKAMYEDDPAREPVLVLGTESRRPWPRKKNRTSLHISEIDDVVCCRGSAQVRKPIHCEPL